MLSSLFKPYNKNGDILRTENYKKVSPLKDLYLLNT